MFYSTVGSTVSHLNTVYSENKVVNSSFWRWCYSGFGFIYFRMRFLSNRNARPLKQVLSLASKRRLGLKLGRRLAQRASCRPFKSGAAPCWASGSPTSFFAFVSPFGLTQVLRQTPRWVRQTKQAPDWSQSMWAMMLNANKLGASLTRLADLANDKRFLKPSQPSTWSRPNRSKVEERATRWSGRLCSPIRGANVSKSAVTMAFKKTSLNSLI